MAKRRSSSANPLRIWRGGIALFAAALAAAAGCGGGGSGGPATLTVYLSAPLHGARASEGRAIVAGAKAAVVQAKNRAGNLRIRVFYLDDTGGGPKWSPVAAAANARRAAEDSSTIGYIGDVDSGATRVSLPITNQAEIVQISPASTAVDLTREASGVDPDRYRPSDRQTFARIVPADDVQERVAESLTKQYGAKNVAVSVDGFAQPPPRCHSHPTLYVTSPFRDTSRLPKILGPKVRGRHGKPVPAAAYGYEAMSLLLDAIRRAGGSGDDRGAVIDAVLATRDRHSSLGDYSIDGNGDTTLDLITVYKVRNCRSTFDDELEAG